MLPYIKEQSYAPANWWYDRGFTIYRGARSYCRSEYGVPLFARDQVYKSHVSRVPRPRHTQVIVKNYY